MSITESERATAVLADDASCLDCGYSLRGLREPRCPECGRRFDPNDPWTMYVGRPMPRFVRRLAGPISVWVRRTVLIACGAILWGSAWLPGARYIEAIGWNVLIVTVAYSLVRRIVRFALRIRYAHRSLNRPPAELYSRRQLLLVALAMSAPICWWPLRVSLLLHRPLLDAFARHAYEVRPMLDPPSTPRILGLYVVTEVRAEPHGVALQVLGGGRMGYRGDDRSGIYAWYDRDLPWYLLWMYSPGSGRWVVVPEPLRLTRMGITPEDFWR